MSGEDIEPGEAWLAKIEEELGASDVGILCLSPQNLTAPWLLFEAGFLRKAATKSRVVPFLHGITPANIGQPIGSLQACEATEEGTRKLVEMLNKNRTPRVEDALLAQQFTLWWPQLRDELGAIPAPGGGPPQRPEREILEEILQTARGIPGQMRILQQIRDNLVFAQLNPGLRGLVLEPDLSSAQSALRAAKASRIATAMMKERDLVSTIRDLAARQDDPDVKAMLEDLQRRLEARGNGGTEEDPPPTAPRPL